MYKDYYDMWCTLAQGQILTAFTFINGACPGSLLLLSEDHLGSSEILVHHDTIIDAINENCRCYIVYNSMLPLHLKNLY